jgi:hypothetical protein
VKVTVAQDGTNLALAGSAAYLPGADNDVETPADNLLRLTNNGYYELGAAFTTSAWRLLQPGQGTAGADGFNASFVFRVPAHSTPPADGFSFVVQRNSPTAQGEVGGGLGSQGMPNSLAVKFDYYPNLNQTGVYANGAMNDIGTNLPFDLTDGSSYQVSLTYDATAKALTQRIVNLSVPTMPPFETTYTTAFLPDNSTASLDASQLIGGDCAFVGFTGATGGATATQIISGFLINGQEVPLTAAPPSPKVTRVWVSGTAWTQPFKQRLAAGGVPDAYGYAIPPPISSACSPGPTSTRYRSRSARTCRRTWPT